MILESSSNQLPTHTEYRPKQVGAARPDPPPNWDHRLRASCAAQWAEIGVVSPSSSIVEVNSARRKARAGKGEPCQVPQLLSLLGPLCRLPIAALEVSLHRFPIKLEPALVHAVSKLVRDSHVINDQPSSLPAPLKIDSQN